MVDGANAGIRVVQTMELQLPVLPDAAGYVPMKLEVHMTDRQAKALKAIADGLDSVQARTLNGLRCVSNPDAVRWMLERLADVMDGKGGGE